MDVTPREVRVYQTPQGRTPYADWFESVRDERAKQRIQARLARVRSGNLGQTNRVGGGVQELKLDYGPGYRVYFGLDGQTLVILLIGGDKRTQHEDIQQAKAYWADYKATTR